MPEAPRILFAGGCHLNGYPVGAEHSLSSVALRSIGHPGAGSPDTLAYVTLRSGRLLVEACRERHADYLVLQIGNYETLPRFEKIFHLRHSSGFSSGTTHSVAFQANPEMQFRATWTTRMVDARRMALAGAFRALGRGDAICNIPAIAPALDGLLTSFRNSPMKGILLLSPFSCPEPLTRDCRRRAEPLFAAAAGEHGCLYVDVFNSLESFGRGPAYEANFADPSHLSRRGHAYVGQLVGQSLRQAIERAQA